MGRKFSSKTRLEMYIKISFNKLPVPYTCVNGAVDVYVLMNKKGETQVSIICALLKRGGIFSHLQSRFFPPPLNQLQHQRDQQIEKHIPTKIFVQWQKPMH